MQKTRRITQILFFLLFVVLFYLAAFPYETGILSDLFLRASPLIAIATILSTKKFISTLILALVILLLSVFLGRYFCGWICP